MNRLLIIPIAITALALISIAWFAPNTVISDKATAMEYHIVLDAGHGGIDMGAIGCQLQVMESEINLDIVLKLNALLTSKGYRITLTRKDEKGLYGEYAENFKKQEMQKRISIIEKASPDMVVSIHQNSCQYAYRRGCQVFFYDEKGEFFAEALQKVLNSELNLPIINRELSHLYGNYFILSKTRCPSVIIECGFLSNKADEELLSKEEHRQRIAEAIVAGIDNYCSNN